MKSPLHDNAVWIELASAGSTQDIAAERLRNGEPIGVVHALDQVAGRGRFERTWISSPGDSLTFSMVFQAYADHPRPYLIGMAVALAAAGVLHCQVQWPNDLVEGGRKVGGILTEIKLDPAGRRVPIVGVGINLNQEEFPESIAHRATSLHLLRGGRFEADRIARAIVARLAILPEPEDWSGFAPIWALFDATPGKNYLMPNGEIASALGVGSEGQLVASIAGETQSILAADALFPNSGMDSGAE